MCGAPAVVAAVLDAAASWDGPIPGADRRAHRRRRRAAADADDRAHGDRARVGVHPDLRTHRDVAAADDEPWPRRVRRPRLARARAPCSAARARPRSACSCEVDDQGEVLARSNVVLEGYWEQPEATADAIVDGWFHTGDGGILDDEGYLTISDRKKDVIISGGENVSSIEVEDVSVLAPARRRGGGHRRARREVGRDGEGARRARAGRDGDGGRPHRALPRAPRALQVPDVGRVPRRARRAPRPASSRSSSSARRTGRAASVRWGKRAARAVSAPRRAYFPSSMRAWVRVGTVVAAALAATTWVPAGVAREQQTSPAPRPLRPPRPPRRPRRRPPARAGRWPGPRRGAPSSGASSSTRVRAAAPTWPGWTPSSPGRCGWAARAIPAAGRGAVRWHPRAASSCSPVSTAASSSRTSSAAPCPWGRPTGPSNPTSAP